MRSSLRVYRCPAPWVRVRIPRSPSDRHPPPEAGDQERLNNSSAVDSRASGNCACPAGAPLSMKRTLHAKPRPWIPAQAGIVHAPPGAPLSMKSAALARPRPWIPACVGMTVGWLPLSALSFRGMTEEGRGNDGVYYGRRRWLARKRDAHPCSISSLHNAPRSAILSSSCGSPLG